MNIKKTLVQLVAASTLLFSAGYVSAGLVVNTNTNTITDTTSNLEWLFLSQTTGLSYNFFEAETAIGGAMENYRFATQAEVMTLLTNNNTGPLGTGSFANAIANLSLWAAGADLGNDGSTWFGVESPGEMVGGFQITSGGNYQFFDFFANKPQGFSAVGYALVVDGESSAAVPVPASVSTPLAAFGAIGLMGFMGLSRKKKLISK